jgi:DNA primase large subunit
LKSFGNTIPDADFSSAEGRLTINSIEMLRKTSMPPCIRQLLDALHADNKLKHDVSSFSMASYFSFCYKGRVHLWAFFKAAGMPLEDALKYTFTRMTAYANPEKEFKYNVRHVYGKEGGGKGVGMLFLLVSRIWISF